MSVGKLILASGSPRRREILTLAGASFTVAPAGADESLPAGTAPADAVVLLAGRQFDLVPLYGKSWIVVLALSALGGVIVFSTAFLLRRKLPWMRSLLGSRASTKPGMPIIREEIRVRWMGWKG